MVNLIRRLNPKLEVNLGFDINYNALYSKIWVIFDDVLNTSSLKYIVTEYILLPHHQIHTYIREIT